MVLPDRILSGCILVAILLISCRKKVDPPPPEPYGNISFSVVHLVNGLPLRVGELAYTNAAGNPYLVSDLMYFISDIKLYGSDGFVKEINATQDIFYINEALAGTKTLRFSDKIPAGDYSSISFVFGISAEKNKSHLFLNPPEALMGWPEVLGGGYHYLMMNGLWKNQADSLKPYNLHLGIGQLYHGPGYNVDSIYAFVDNSFTVHLPNSSFRMEDQQTLTFRLSMHISEWLQNPHNYDFNYWGGAIMQNQPAMQMVCENGWNVFSIQQQ